MRSEANIIAGQPRWVGILASYNGGTDKGLTYSAPYVRAMTILQRRYNAGIPAQREYPRLGLRDWLATYRALGR